MAVAATDGAGTTPRATTTAATTSRFAAACGALSRYVKAAEQTRVSRPHPAVRPLPLMPGADIDDAAPEGQETAGPAPAQLTIVYGGWVLVLHDVPADRAAGLLQAAAAAAARGAKKVVADMPVARKASLQRFMEKRKTRVAARGEPYLRPGASADHHDELTLAL